MKPDKDTMTRRRFLKTSTQVTALAGLSIVRPAYGKNNDRIRVGLVGCGGRGTGAAQDALMAGPNIELVAMGDIFKAHKVLGQKFCISGGIPNYLLSVGTEDEVRQCCRKIIDGVARDGGYIMDSGAIVQNDAKVENIKAMTDFTREYGVY